MKTIPAITQVSDVFLIKLLAPKDYWWLGLNGLLLLAGLYAMYAYGTSKYEMLLWLVIAIELLYPLKVKVIFAVIVLLAGLFGAALIIDATLIADRVGTLLFLVLILELYSLVVTTIRNTKSKPR